MSYTGKSEQVLINELLGNSPATGKSVQEALNGYYGFYPTQYSIQELFGLKTGTTPYTSKSVQQYLFDNLKERLSLTGSYTNYSIQELLKRGINASVPIEVMVEGAENALQNYIRSLSGLEAYLPYNETSGTNADDKSTSNRDMTYEGVLLGQPGKVGLSVYGDGTNDRIYFGSAISLTGAFTLGIFVRKTDTTNTLFFGSGTGNTAGAGILNSAGSYNGFFRAVNAGASLSANIGYSGALNNTWVLLIITRDGSNNVSGSINGNTLQAMGTLSGTFSLTEVMKRDAAYAQGYAQHCFVRSVVMTQAEITRIKNIAGF